MRAFNHYIFKFLSLSIFLGVATLHAQKINTDSLLVSIIKDMRTSNNYSQNIEKCLLGKKIAPEYLDFQVLLGKNYEFTNQNDSARYYYQKVLDENPKYEEVFLYLINLNISEQKYEEALVTTEKALVFYPKKIIYFQKKSEIYELRKELENQKKSLQKTLEVFPNDSQTRIQLEQINENQKNNRIGINYNYTTIGRKDVGPWHMVHLEYINYQKWGSLNGRISYAERFAANNFVAKGVQYEIESYYKIGKRNYTYWDVTLSNDMVFPKYKLGGSIYLNSKKGWETDLGFRYIQTQNLDILTLVTGVSKHTGDYWLSVKAYLNNNKKNYNPVLSINNRYYFNSKYDYLTLNLGFGTSPDERNTISQIQNRLNLNSFRIGTGYYKFLYKKFITGIQMNYNLQEYIPNEFQNEYELSLLCHYKF
ncbi:YaiO family outer membrane beta-barrel protein [Flavobacterium sp. TSSA_36]|uniref:YaiO family outer membrane beta-barrel protein n=1 Tax=Flavobacterium sp. TSSA_36 TaxID=3447669 RepID=UPI003F325009